ncbi:hypothetical protein [Lysobacter sp. TY2-98]|uniref:hypothetical protein n=1 Tax=Lysobacter sp. TY2-98 TaxID=2290922 RepID=UPI0013B3B891|nr:hypothetical protein [Lysobacter sp. TY2-98]
MRAFPAFLPRAAIAASVPVMCTGCHMLGALFDVHTFRGIVAGIVLVAAIAFLFSKAERR